MVFDPLQPKLITDYSRLPEPEYGDRMDSRFGGPTPWQQSLQQWSDMGNSPGQRPFKDIGRFDITNQLPLSPLVPTMKREQAPIQQPAPQPGLFESLGRGLPVMVTQFLGNGDIDKFVGGLGGALGSVLDMPLNVMPAFSELSGGYSVESMFDELPDDALKREYESYIASDTVNATRYMSQYLDQRGTEVADLLGVSGVFAPALTASNTLSEQVRRLFFGGMSALGDGVARTYIGMEGPIGRNAREEILGGDGAQLPEELKLLRERHERGDINFDEMLDELTVGRYRWTSDDSLWGAGLSLVMDIISDPLIWASFGMGAAAKSVATGAIRTSRNAIGQSVRKSGNWDRAVDDIVRSSEYTTKEAWAKGVGGSEGVTREVAKWAETNAPTQFAEGLSKLSKKERALYDVEPIVNVLAKTAYNIDNMFGWFGLGKVGRAMSQRVTSNRMRGWASYYGAKRFKGLQSFAGNRAPELARYQAIAGQNSRMSLEQRHMAKEAMGADPQWRGRDKSPQEIAERRMSMDESNIVEMQRHTAQRGEDFLTDKVGEEAFQARRADEMNLLANDLSAMTGKTAADALTYIQKADRKTLQLVHETAYGYNISRFLESKRTSLTDLQTRLERAVAGGDTVLADEMRRLLGMAEHYGLVSERTLTVQRAQALLASIDSATDGSRRAAADAVEQYDSLGHSFGDAKLGADEVRTSMLKHLRHLLEDESRLMREVNPADLHPDVARAMGGSKYEIGLAPSDRWGLSQSPDGTITGVNTYLDVVDDISPTDFNRPWGQRDIWKERFFGSIHGARLFYEAEAKFKEMGVREYGLNKSEGSRLFRAIHNESSRQNTGVRGLQPDSIIRIAEEVDLSPAQRARTGSGSLLELTLRAFEGDIATVGVTAKATGRMKTFGGRLDNLVGVISEGIYPKVRFGLSPIFVLMETVEGPFFALLRGIKPGVRWTADDIRMNSILEDLHSGTTRYADQLERAQLAVYDQDLAVRLANDINAKRGWKKLLPYNWRTKNPLEHGIKVSGPWDLKRLQYVKQAGREASVAWEQTMDRVNPELLARWKAEMGTTSPQQLYMRMMEEAGDISDSGRHVLHMMDSVKPLDLGRRERVRMGDVARFNGFDTVADMQGAIARGAMTETTFKAKYSRLNMSDEYSNRAWKIASGFSDDQWRQGIGGAFTDSQGLIDVDAVASYETFHRWMANKTGQSFEEFMNVEYGDLPQLVNSIRDIPVGSMYQTIKDDLTNAGMDVFEVGSRQFEESRRIMADHGPDAPTTERQVSVKTGKEGKNYANRQLSKHERGINTVAADPVGSAPKNLQKGLDVRVDPKTGQTMAQLSAQQMDEAVTQLFADFDATPGQVNPGLDSGLAWYDEMNTTFLAISHAMPDSVVDGMLARWAELAPRELTEALGDNVKGKGGLIELLQKRADDGDVASAQAMRAINDAQEARQAGGRINLEDMFADEGIDGLRASLGLTDEAAAAVTDVHAELRSTAKVQLAARLNLAFSGSQMNSSVLFGMRSILETIDEAALGRGMGAKGLEVVVNRLTSVLRDFGNLPDAALGPKLLDFYDSLVGNKTRTLTKNLDGLDALQPGAMDVWMKRAWGFGDSAYLNKMAVSRLTRRGDDLSPANIAAEEVRFADEMGWDLEDTRTKGNDAPTEAEYVWMLQSTNQLTRHINDTDMLEAGRDLSVAEVQAAMWVGLQRRMDYAGTPPTTLLRQAGVQTAAEAFPGPGSVIEKWMPDVRAMLDEFDGDEAMLWEALETISHDVQARLIPSIAQESGAIPLNIIDASGRWTPPGIDPETGLPRPSTFTPNATAIWTGSPAATETASRMQALMMGQEAVYALSTWDEVLLKPTRKKPLVRSNAAQGRVWSLDLKFDSEMSSPAAKPYFEYLNKWFGGDDAAPGAMHRAGLGDGQFEGSMVGILDDGSTAVRNTWEQTADPKRKAAHVAAERRAVGMVARRDRAVQAAKDAVPEKPKKRGNPNYEADVKAHAEARLVKDQRMQDIREHYDPIIDDAKATVADLDPNFATRQRAADWAGLKEADLAELADGTWVHRLDPDADPMPINVEYNPVQVNYWDGDHAARLTELGVDVERLRSRYTDEVRGVFTDSYQRVAPSSTKASVEAQALRDPTRGDAFFQREIDPANPDASRGRARAAFAPAAADGRAAAYFLKDRTDPSTALHEGFHLFSRHLDESGKQSLVAAYNDAHGLTGTRGAKRSFTRHVEEWSGREFERFAAGDLANAPELAPIFKSYAEWAKDSPTLSAGSTVSAPFERVLQDWGDTPSNIFNMDQERAWYAGRQALLRAEDEAFSTAYYRRGRTWMERSLNHPYLGLYPISYMWGKVLPELTKFLVRRPFGLKAPMGGMMGAKHIWRNVQMQLEVDEGLSEWVDTHPESIRMLQMMTPGTPWELPVNMPAVARHFQERQAENTVRGMQGKEPLSFDMGASITDSVSYAVGYAQLFERLGKVGEEVKGMTQDVGAGVEEGLTNFTDWETQTFI